MRDTISYPNLGTLIPIKNIGDSFTAIIGSCNFLMIRLAYFMFCSKSSWNSVIWLDKWIFDAAIAAPNDAGCIGPEVIIGPPQLLTKSALAESKNKIAPPPEANALLSEIATIICLCIGTCDNTYPTPFLP